MIKYKAITILVLSLFVLVCSKTKNPVKNPPSFQFESSQSACGGNNSLGKMEAPPKDNSVIFSLHGDTIWVIHRAFYDCCSKIEVEVVKTANGFDLYDHNVSDRSCDCLCIFDITTLIFDLRPGTYFIRYFNIYNMLLDSAVVDIPAKYTGFESSQSKCKGGLYKTDAKTTPYDLEDSVLAWSHADTAWVMHKNDLENCASIVKTKIERTLEGFDLYEYYIVKGNAYCLCYFDITTTPCGLSPGVYLIRVFDTVGEFVGEVELVIPPNE